MARYYLIAETNYGKKYIPLKYHDVVYNKVGLELIDYLTSQYKDINDFTKSLMHSFKNLGVPTKIYIEYYVNKEARKQKLVLNNALIKSSSLEIFQKKEKKEKNPKIDLLDERKILIENLLSGIKTSDERINKEHYIQFMNSDLFDLHIKNLFKEYYTYCRNNVSYENMDVISCKRDFLKNMSDYKNFRNIVVFNEKVNNINFKKSDYQQMELIDYINMQ